MTDGHCWKPVLAIGRRLLVLSMWVSPESCLSVVDTAAVFSRECEEGTRVTVCLRAPASDLSFPCVARAALAPKSEVYASDYPA